MPTYVYETLALEGEQPERFEISQSMKEDALTQHPDTGVPVRRIISGGAGIIMGGAASAPAEKPATSSSLPSGCCGGGCGCH